MIIIIKKTKKQNERQPFSICVMMYLVLCVYSFPLNFIYYFFFLSSFPTCTFCERRSNLLCFFFPPFRSSSCSFGWGGSCHFLFAMPSISLTKKEIRIETQRSPFSCVYSSFISGFSSPCYHFYTTLHYTWNKVQQISIYHQLASNNDCDLFQF